MKSPGALKHILMAFVLAAALYFSVFYLIEHSRVRNGPWRVAFASAGGDAAPVLIINEPRLNISNVRLTFPGQSAPRTNAIIIFDHPQEVPFDVPFGQCVFMDVITQPGNATFSLFGHQIQLLPSGLTIDKQERAWKSETTIQVPTLPQ